VAIALLPCPTTARRDRPRINNDEPQAIDRDPNHALSYAGIAECYVELAQALDFLPHREAMPKAREAAMKALGIDANLADAHTTLGLVSMYYDWDWPEAEKEFQLAIDLTPSSSWADQQYAFYLSAVGRHDQAIAESRLGREFDPLNLAAMTRTASILFRARRYDQGIEEAKRALEIDPDFLRAHDVLSRFYVMKGMWDEKVAADQRTLALTGASPEEVASLGRAYAMSGVRGFWEWWLRRFKEQAAHGYVSDFLFAGFYASVGDKDSAFHSLERAYEQRNADLVFLKVYPWLDPLRDDPRFQDLVRRMNFPE
jgi:tetratricopeptide (TPR) repeat protein